jgi:glycosyltransferase involved in cell wall biosynthesis
MKVSIIIPVYNVSAYIERCIKSVMNQTYQDIECILVNDATPDDSIAIAERLVADYKGPVQFKIFNHEHNRGQSAARNTGVDAASGDYLYFIDSDDEITPDCIEKLSRPVLNDPTIEMVEGCYAQVARDSHNNLIERPFPRQQLELATPKAVKDYFFSKQDEHICAWNKLINRVFFIKNQLYFKESLFWGEDFFWMFHYNRYLSHLYIIPDITYKYKFHIRPDAMTSIPYTKYRAYYGRIYAEIAKNLSPEDSVREIKYILKSFCLFYVDGPTPPIYKQVACIFLNALKDKHSVKEWFFLKSIVILSKFSLARKAITKVGELLKRNFREKKR